MQKSPQHTKTLPLPCHTIWETLHYNNLLECIHICLHSTYQVVVFVLILVMCPLVVSFSNMRRVWPSVISRTPMMQSAVYADSWKQQVYPQPKAAMMIANVKLCNWIQILFSHLFLYAVTKKINQKNSYQMWLYHWRKQNPYVYC